MATQITRIGGMATIEIPEEMLRQANLAVGDRVEWALTEAGELAVRAPGETVEVEEGYEEWKLREIEAGIADHEAGRSVDHERVVEWLKSWGTDHVLPPPL